ncbi:MAG: hypothetical protein LBB21_04795 [Holosporaceae bacterium]|nr:hypothetical protein [Holosporaceae bacterium]
MNNRSLCIAIGMVEEWIIFIVVKIFAKRFCFLALLLVPVKNCGVGNVENYADRFSAYRGDTSCGS